MANPQVIDERNGASADQEVTKIEQDLGICLPQSIREWCSFSLSWDRMGRAFSIRDTFVVEKLEHHDAISLLLQGEDDVYWACKSETLHLPDPPVTTYYWNYDEKRFFEYEQVAPSVSCFALDYLISYWHPWLPSHHTTTAARPTRPRRTQTTTTSFACPRPKT